MTWYAHNRAHPSEHLARQLVADPNFRILRKLPEWTDIWCRSMPHAHRAAADAWATACLLMMPGCDGRPVAAHLVDRARKPTHRLFAENAPFSAKDALKAAGYRWHPDRRCWWAEGQPELMANEAAWLHSFNPAIKPVIERVDWYDRWK
jgi:hypothetical protein